LGAGGAQGAGAAAAADAQRAGGRTSSSASSPSRSPTPAWGRAGSRLARERWGGLGISANGVWRCLRRHGLNTRTRRLSLVAGYAARYERRPALPKPERHVEASRPGELVGLDCFYVGRLSGTKGAVWQYTAIDVASSYAWAELHSSTAQSQARHCSALVRRVASDLAHAGWRLEAVHACQGRLKTDSSRRLKTDPSGHCLPASGHCLPASGRSPARP
jgi:hypothetical protein